MRVNTSWERFSRGRSSTRSIATPRRWQERIGTRSMISGSSGQRVGAMAVDLRGPRPAIAGLEDELAVGQRQPDQERQRRVGVGVGRDLEQGHAS